MISEKMASPIFHGEGMVIITSTAEIDMPQWGDHLQENWSEVVIENELCVKKLYFEGNHSK